MPTSATGRTDRTRAATDDGFTLVELLVVLVLIGVAAVTVMLAWPSGASPARQEAEAMGRLLTRVGDHAILNNKTLGLRVTGQAYELVEFRDGQWQRLQTQTVTAQRPWAEQVMVRVERFGAEVNTRRQGDGRADAPVVTFLPHGDVSPVQLTFSDPQEQVMVTVDDQGDVIIDGQNDR